MAGNSLEDKHLAMVRMTSQSPEYESFEAQKNSGGLKDKALIMTPYFQSHDDGYMDLDMVDLTITNFQDADIQIGEKGNH